jgi:hypothetical protein
MKEIKVESWEQFEQEVFNLQQFRDDKLKAKHLFVSEVIFRGQANAEWELKSTLERYSDKSISRIRYYHYLEKIKPAVETYTGQKWDLGNPKVLDDDFPVDWPGYAFMIYARHHGFPSPLLDWTLSPYIALFFSMQTVCNSENAAVFAFIETPEGIKGGYVGAPKIDELGVYETSHERHFTQQAKYTICTRKEREKWVYSSHQSYFDTGTDRQDYIRKIVIPRSLREEILKRLYLMNINEYSLFRTEESLMSMLAFREIT